MAAPSLQIEPISYPAHNGRKMCGRYSLASSPRELALRFKLGGEPISIRPRWNIAPSQDVLAVSGSDDRQASLMRWGLVPRWAKSGSSIRPIINARAETVAEKPTFRDAFRRRRCLILADGFYEWQKVGDTRRPMRIGLRSGEPFAFAGLWSEVDDPDGNRVQSCAIITTAANDLLRPIHHRMPVILPAELEGIWLDTALDNAHELTHLLTPYPDDDLETFEVSRLVNSASNDIAEVAAPVR